MYQLRIIVRKYTDGVINSIIYINYWIIYTIEWLWNYIAGK